MATAKFRALLHLLFALALKCRVQSRAFSSGQAFPPLFGTFTGYLPSTVVTSECLVKTGALYRRRQGRTQRRSYLETTAAQIRRLEKLNREDEKKNSGANWLNIGQKTEQTLLEELAALRAEGNELRAQLQREKTQHASTVSALTRSLEALQEEQLGLIERLEALVGSHDMGMNDQQKTTLRKALDLIEQMERKEQDPMAQPEEEYEIPDANAKDLVSQGYRNAWGAQTTEDSTTEA